MAAEQIAPTAQEALSALSARSGSPVWLHLLLADRCNHACQHCYQVQGLKGELSREQVESLLRDFSAGGGFVVAFSGGEPTLRDDLLPLLSYAHELGLATVLYTNGFTMTESLASALAGCHVWRVEVSLYSDSPAEHDAVTRIPGSWLKTTQGIRWLRAHQVNVVIKFTPTTASGAGAAQLVELAAELDAHLFLGELVNAGEAGRLQPTQVRRSPERALSASNSTHSPTVELNSLAGKPCNAGAQLSVRSDGIVQPCSQLQVSMGDVGSGSASLGEVALSNVARFFRELTWADLPGCRSCVLLPHCRRCFASAAAEVGDMLAPYRGACELAVERYRTHVGASVPLVMGQGTGPDRDPRVGPYRLGENGELRPTNTNFTAYDLAVVDRNPWLRPSHEDLQAAACGVGPADQARGLVQLRRRKQ